MANQGWIANAKLISSLYCVICVLYYELVISNQLQINYDYQLHWVPTVQLQLPLQITITTSLTMNSHWINGFLSL